MLTLVDLALIECMYDEDRIGKHHGNVERILHFCTPKKYRDRNPLGKLKKRLRQLAVRGYLLRKQGRFEAFSLSQRGVIIAERIKAKWTLDEMNDAEKSFIDVRL